MFDIQKIKKILILFLVISIIVFVPIKMLAVNNDKNIIQSNSKINNTLVSNVTNVSHNVYQNVYQVELMQKVWDTLVSFKSDKQVIYEFKRKLEKQDVLVLLINKQNFLDLVENLPYNENQKKLIVDNFGNIGNFAESLYYFYLFLILSQIDENTIANLQKQSSFLKKKIYKIDPTIVEKLKMELSKKDDPDLRKALEVIDKDLYQPNLDDNKINIILSQLNKINFILNNYELFKDSKSFIWMVNKRDEIIKSLRL